MKNAQLYYWAIVIAFSLGWLIHRQFYVPSKLPEPTPQAFKIPKISQHRWRQPLESFDINYIRKSEPYRYVGKFAFADSIFIPDDRLLWSAEDFLRYDELPSQEAQGRGLQVKIDPKLILCGRRNDKTRAYLPAFIFNETPNPQYLVGMDWQPWHIIEAKDTQGNWRPIQISIPSDCGTQMGFLKLKPQEFCILNLPVFVGDFATELRLRIRNGKQIMVSNSFPAKINQSQFNFSPTDPAKERVQKYPKKDWERFFLGSIPLEFDRNR
ncbi:MAG: hypothetical protein KTR30_29460 [Saprospiraceae bacterium]|nr:hypothetical protein [Saprospiraceae bacterium]